MSRPPLSPILVALAFPLGIIVSNPAEPPGWQAALLVLAFTLVLAAFVGWLAQRLLPGTPAVALTAALAVTFCLGYGHIDIGLLDERVPNKLLLPLLLGGVVVPCMYALLRAREQTVAALSAFVRNAAVALVAIQILQLLPQVKVSGGSSASTARRVVQRREVSRAGPAPDIYYIVLDGYTRADVLREIYGHDNREFLDALERRGFFVAREARSNYTQTWLSLTSALNMRYLDGEARRAGRDSTDRRQVLALLKDNALVARLRELGYRYRHIGSFWHVTRRDPTADEDIYYLPEFADEYTFVFLQTTVFHPLLRALPPYRALFHPGRVHLHQLDHVARPKQDSRPTFTFAHLMCPHPPYVFDRQGLVADFDTSVTKWRPNRGYVQQLRFLNEQLLKLIDRIDGISGKDAVIVLQGDHGTASRGIPEEPTPSHVVERLSVLTALRTPEEVRARLYASITPVNLFRAVLGGLFGEAVERLPDRCYYSPYKKPFWLRETDPAGRFVD